MIVLDRKDTHRDRHYISIQRPDKSYTYLHWDNAVTACGRNYLSRYHALLEDFKDITAIGPNPLVVWSSEDEADLC